jgi:Golgi SNAP receptor complex protein 2
LEQQKLKDVIEIQKQQNREAERATARTALLASGEQPRVTPTLTEVALQEREDATLRYSDNRLGEYITLGGGVLDSLRNQKGMMKTANRRVLDAGTSLGLSQSVMRVISRRTRQDRYIFYTGVVVVFLVIYWCWRYII